MMNLNMTHNNKFITTLRHFHCVCGNRVKCSESFLVGVDFEDYNYSNKNNKTIDFSFCESNINVTHVTPPDKNNNKIEGCSFFDYNTSYYLIFGKYSIFSEDYGWHRLDRSIRNNMKMNNIWRLPFHKRYGDLSYYFMICGENCSELHNQITSVKNSDSYKELVKCNKLLLQSYEEQIKNFVLLMKWNKCSDYVKNMYYKKLENDKIIYNQHQQNILRRKNETLLQQKRDKYNAFLENIPYEYIKCEYCNKLLRKIKKSVWDENCITYNICREPKIIKSIDVNPGRRRYFVGGESAMICDICYKKNHCYIK